MGKKTKAEELAEIYKAQGTLNPENCVLWAAEHKDSALHAGLNWDDTAAAHQHRIWQMRQIIVEVRAIYPDKTPQQVYVSVESSRGKKGGYSALVEVMNSERLREYVRVGKKYQELQEFAGVRDAVDRVVQAYNEKNSPKAA